MQTKQSETKQNLLDQVLEKGENYEEILISGGAGFLPFIVGYLHALIQIIGKERLKDFKIGGVSVGAIAAGYIFVTINQDKYDMKNLYESQLRRGYSEESRRYYGFFTHGENFRQSAEHYFKIAKEMNIPSPNGILHMPTTIFNKFGIPKKVLITEFDDKEELGDALESTCNIPFVVKKSFFTKYRGHKTIDGGILGPVPYRYTDSKKIFLNFLPKFTCLYPLDRPKNTTYVHTTENTDVKFPVDYWIWDQEWADDLFMKGVEAANNQQQKLIKIFQKQNQKQKVQ